MYRVMIQKNDQVVYDERFDEVKFKDSVPFKPIVCAGRIVGSEPVTHMGSVHASKQIPARINDEPEVAEYENEDYSWFERMCE